MSKSSLEKSINVQVGNPNSLQTKGIFFIFVVKTRLAMTPNLNLHEFVCTPQDHIMSIFIMFANSSPNLLWVICHLVNMIQINFLRSKPILKPIQPSGFLHKAFQIYFMYLHTKTIIFGMILTNFFPPFAWLNLYCFASFKYIILIMLLQFSQFPPFIPPPPCTLQPSSIPPPQFMSMGCTYKFFEFCFLYHSLPLPINLMPTNYVSIPCTFSPLPLPTENPPCDVHFSDSVPVPVVCLVLFLLFFFFLRFGC